MLNLYIGLPWDGQTTTVKVGRISEFLLFLRYIIITGGDPTYIR